MHRDDFTQTYIDMSIDIPWGWRTGLLTGERLRGPRHTCLPLNFTCLHTCLHVYTQEKQAEGSATASVHSAHTI